MASTYSHDKGSSSKQARNSISDSAMKGDSQEGSSNKENMTTLHNSKSPAAPPTTTPSKQRYSLGSASAYYFKYMNKKDKNDTSLLDDDRTGTISSHGISFLDEKSMADTSMISIGASSSSSEEGDLLNKSTLSDTTELTASNFVLAATSRQKLRLSAMFDRNNTSPGESKSKLQVSEDSGTSPEIKEDSKVVETIGMSPAKAAQVNDANKTDILKDTPQHEDLKGSPANRRHSIRSASPSLRSRISASPNSLRNFTASLKNSRMKRQMQREEEAKRRLSSDSLVLSMNAQLEALQTDTFNRKRLPPAFAQASPQTQASTSSPANSNFDAGNTTQEIMGAMKEIFGELDQSKGSNDQTPEKKRSSITARRSSVGRLLETMVTDLSADSIDLASHGKESVSVAKDISDDSMDIDLASHKKASLVSTKNNDNGDTEKDVQQIPVSIEFSESRNAEVAPSSQKRKDTKNGFESPISTPIEPNNLRLTPGSQRRLTPTKLTSTPSRILNPRVIDSPARNTRSAARKKKIESEKNIDALNMSVEEIGTSALRGQRSNEGNIASLAYLPESESSVLGKSGEDTASLGDLSGVLGTPSSTGKESVQSENNGMSPLETNAEDTASLGDLNDVLGTQSTSSPKEVVNSPEIESSVLVKSGEDTASLGDLSGVLGTPSSTGKESAQPSNSELPSIETNAEDTASLGDLSDVLGIESTTNVSLQQRAVETPKPNNFRQAPFGSNESTPAGVKEDMANTMSSKPSNKGGGDTASIGDLMDALGTLSKKTSSSTPESIPGNISGLSNKGSDETASMGDIGEILGTQSPIKAVAENMTGMDVAQKSPMRLTSQSLLSFTPTKAGQSSPHSLNHKSPMRLKPNSHVKPTPTKIAPTPRRVVNPRSPHSPARNTRSAKKSLHEVDISMAMSIDPQPERLTGKRERDGSVEKTDDGSSSANGTMSPSPGDVASSKRRRSSVLKPVQINGDKENFSPKSPKPKKSQPLGILSSKKKSLLKSSQRSVAFGSPEAAEYHVGSPSVSLTPMPSSKVKELFSIPRGNPMTGTGIFGASDISSVAVEDTVEIEDDLNVLVDKITVDNMKESPSLSPIANLDDKEQTGVFSLPSSNLDLESRETSTFSESLHPNEDTTVELEGGIDRLIANAMQSGDSSSDIGSVKHYANETSGEKRRTPEQIQVNSAQRSMDLRTEPETSVTPTHSKTSPAGSVEMTDSRSIASISRSEKFTSEFSLGAQKLDFSFHPTQDDQVSNEKDHSMDVEAGHTVELEGNMTKLLAAAGVRDGLTDHLQGTGLGEKEENTSFQSHRTGISEMEEESFVEEVSPRRSPIASRRFTLSPAEKMSLSHVDILGQESKDPEVLNGMNDYSTSELEQKSTPTVDEGTLYGQTEPITLTFDEIVAATGILPGKSDHPNGWIAGDTLVRFAQCSDDIDSITFERWNQFVEAVCSEVEKRTETSDAANTGLQSFIDSQPSQFLKLQKRLRSIEDEKINEDLQRLAESGKTIIKFEWDAWLASVMESFQNPLNEISKDVGGDVIAIDRASKYCADIEAKLKLMSSRRVQHARRKSLSRRKVSEESLSCWI